MQLVHDQESEVSAVFLNIDMLKRLTPGEAGWSLLVAGLAGSGVDPSWYPRTASACQVADCWGHDLPRALEFMRGEWTCALLGTFASDDSNYQARPKNTV